MESRARDNHIYNPAGRGVKTFVWTGLTLGINAIHIWRLERKDSETIVKTEESWEEILARIFRGLDAEDPTEVSRFRASVPQGGSGKMIDQL